MRKQVRPCTGYLLLASSLTVKASAYADYITVFVSHRLDIKAVKKTAARYEHIVGAKINFDESEGLWLGAWKGSVSLERRTRSGLASNWSEIGRKYRLMPR